MGKKIISRQSNSKNLLPWKKAGIITLTGILAFFLLIISHHFLRAGQLPENIVIGDMSVGGMNKEEFTDKIQKNLANKKTLSSVYGDTEVPLEIPLSVKNAFVDNAWDFVYAKESSHQWFGAAVLDMRSLFRKSIIDLSQVPVHAFDKLDYAYLYDIYNLPQVYEGKVSYASNKIITETSSSGVYISEKVFNRELVRLFFSKKSALLELPILDTKPQYDEEGIGELGEHLRQLLDTERSISHRDFPEKVYSLDSENIKKLLTASYNFNTHQFVIGFDNAELDLIADFFKAEDAVINITSDYYVQIEDGINGVLIDKEELRSVLRDNFNDTGNEILMLKKGTEDLSQRSAELHKKHKLKHVVSEFTTYHSCCANRVENIHLIADLLDQRIIKAGETLDINKIIGERTLEQGFKPAGSILKGELVDSVGGGISQFITTLHNAVYWGGYEIVAHKPHSIYFSRYPQGIEATINWPYVDYIFRNDTDSSIMLDTEYTDTSITVRLLGDNADRVFVGDHRGKTWKNIVRSSSNARQVTSSVSTPYNYREPLVRYIDDPLIPRGEQFIDQRGGQGWSVMVERNVTLGGKVLHHEKTPVHYLSEKDTVIRVHPCDNPSQYIPSCYSR